MDVTTFFTRLLRTSAPDEAESADAVDDDYRKFDETWQAIQDTLLHPDERQIIKGISFTDVPAQLGLLVDILVKESNQAEDDTTGQCLEYFLKHDILAQLEKLSQADRPFGIKREVLNATNNLIILLSDRFLVHNAVHRPLRRLLRSSIGDEDTPANVFSGGGNMKVYGAAATMDHKRTRSITGPVGQDYEADLVDLMCTLCSKMRAYPPLLLIFFHDRGWVQPHHSLGSLPVSEVRERALSPAPSTVTSHSQQSANSTSSARFDFLLFSYLLRFVHRDGKIGDFARAGLLFLFDIAFLEPDTEGTADIPTLPVEAGADALREARTALARYMLEGDFAEVMAAGLGAVYSVLPSKLEVPSAWPGSSRPSDGASVDEGAEQVDKVSDTGPRLARSTDNAVRTQIDQLLKLFGFLQDITNRCSGRIASAIDGDQSAETESIGSAISASIIIKAMRASFLDNVLYPSILECSPTDGSAVAVITYLEAVLSKLDDGPVLTAMLAYLLPPPMDASTVPKFNHEGSSDGEAAIRPALTQPQSEISAVPADRFTLKDLLLENIQSENAAASAAALRLASTLLSEHCKAAAARLIADVPVDVSSVSRSRDQHSDAAMYEGLLRRIDHKHPRISETAGFAAYLADSISTLQADRCGVAEPEGTPSQPDRLALDHADRLSEACLSALSTCLGRTPDENIALTGAVASMLRCPARSLMGWLLVDRRRPESTPETGLSADEQDSDESDDEYAHRSARRPPTQSNDPFISAADEPVLPVIYLILRDLTDQIARVRAETAEFERLLIERRHSLLGSADAEVSRPDGLAPGTAQIVTGASPVRRPSRPSPFGSLRSFFSPRKAAVDHSSAGDGSPTPQARSTAAPDISPQDTRPQTPTRARSSVAGLIQLDPVERSPLRSTPRRFASSPYLTPDRGARQLVGDRPDSPASGLSSTQSATLSSAAEAPKSVSLDRLLDNCVIIEEFIKEMVALITARRAVGIDI